MPPRTYSRDEVQAILADALERQHEEGDRLTHDDLLAIGKELGVSREAIELAVARSGDDLEPQRQVRLRVQRMRRAFVLHLVVYLVASLFLLTVDLEPLDVTYKIAGPLWFVWVILAWGIGLVGHAAVVALARNRDKIEARVRVAPRAQGKRVDVAADPANDEGAEPDEAAAVEARGNRRLGNLSS